jgi:hypothetical protein
MPNMNDMSDKTFYHLALLKKLPSWGHEVKLRIIYVMLIVLGRQRGGVDKILSLLESIEKSGFHLTINYFWIQMVTYHIMSATVRMGIAAGGTTGSKFFGTMTNGIPIPMNSDPATIHTVNDVLEKAMSFKAFMSSNAVTASTLRDQLLYEQ